MICVGVVASVVPLCYVAGCGVGCDVFAVVASFPHRFDWVRIRPGCWVMLWYGAGCRYRGFICAHYLACWGPAGFSVLFLVVYALYSYYCFPRGRGLFLPFLQIVG